MCAVSATTIAGSPGRAAPSRGLDAASGDLGDHLDDLAHRVPAAAADVEDVRRAGLVQRGDRGDVGVGQVLDVDEVPDAGAVRGGVLAAEDHRLIAAVERVEDHRDQVGAAEIGQLAGWPCRRR